MIPFLCPYRMASAKTACQFGTASQSSSDWANSLVGVLTNYEPWNSSKMAALNQIISIAIHFCAWILEAFSKSPREWSTCEPNFPTNDRTGKEANLFLIFN